MTKELMSLPAVERLDHTGLRYAHQFPQCEHTRTQDPTKSFQRVQRCKLHAFWLVDGVKLCERHAGNRVLPVLQSHTEAAKEGKDQTDVTEQE
jgi:tRNA G10  N-methylase Trm11